MRKRLQLLLLMVSFIATTAMAQVTTSGISGKVTSAGEEVIGATVTAVHVPSSTTYRAVTNVRNLSASGQKKMPSASEMFLMGPTGKPGGSARAAEMSGKGS